MIKVGKLFPILALLSAIVGARLQSSILPYFTIVCIVTYIVLVGLDKTEHSWYTKSLFCIGAALLLQTSLMTNGLVGSDIHTEYYFYKLSYTNGWNPSIVNSYNTSLGTTLIAPFLAKLLGINGVWIFKLIYPCLTALIPVILYKIYKDIFEEQKAALAVFFFISIPTWSMELVGLPRQQLAELMLAVMLFSLCIAKWKLSTKIIIILISSILGVIFHYSTAPVIVAYLIGGTFLLCFLKWKESQPKIIFILSFIVVGAGLLYYLKVSGGVVERNLYVVIRLISHRIGMHLPDLYPGTSGSIEALNTMGREPLIQTALGLDFFKVSLLGKLFRLLQGLTELSLVIGAIVVFFKRKNFKKEYLAYTAVAVAFLGLTAIVPQFAGSINATRMYQLTLLMAAPLLVIGGLVIFRKVWILTLLLIVPYFLFTSGLIFEVTKQPNISNGELPYSFALSSNRIEVIAKFTDNDYAVMEWGIKNLKGVNWAFDINGMLLFSESLDPSRWMYYFYYIPRDAITMPKDTYVFLTEKNIETGELTFKPHWWNITGSTTGMRTQFPFDFVNWDAWAKDKHIIYQKGYAQIWGP